MNEWIALCRATWKDLLKYPKVNWLQKFEALCKKYGNKN